MSTRLQHIAESTGVNIGALLTTVALSLNQFFDWVLGTLPAISLLLSTATLLVLLYYHVQNVKLTKLKIKELEKRMNEVEP